MKLFVLLSPLVFLSLMSIWSKDRDFFRRLGAFLGGFLWTYAFTIFYWLFRIREQVEYDPNFLFFHFLSTEFLIFWIPNIVLYLLFGRRHEKEASTDSFLFWFGGLIVFFGIRDAISLLPSAQPTELFVIPLYRLLIFTLCHLVYERWEETYDLYKKILWGLIPIILFSLTALIVSYAFLGFDWLAILVWSIVAAALAFFIYIPRLSRQL